jgi:23S rRNA (cytidine1920-2'-O)/16S rRNA (cytidine1409-2'-O)-methyltransferase
MDGVSAPPYAQIVPRPTFLLALVSPIRQREKALAPTPGLFFRAARASATSQMPLKQEDPRKGASRLDLVLVERGLAPSRARARDLIKRGLVAVAGKVEVRTAAAVTAGVAVAVAGGSHHVSRGAVKLAAALDHFGFPVAAVVALDIGASTGGFTQVLLERGAARVYAVDVGHGQLHACLARLPAVVSLEGRDARSLNAALIKAKIGAIVADVSFISLRKALPAALALARPQAWLIALIKPQFEVGPGATKKGIVRDAQAHAAVCDDIAASVASLGWTVAGVIPSPIAGGDGNREFVIAACSS